MLLKKQVFPSPPKLQAQGCLRSCSFPSSPQVQATPPVSIFTTKIKIRCKIIRNGVFFTNQPNVHPFSGLNKAASWIILLKKHKGSYDPKTLRRV